MKTFFIFSYLLIISVGCFGQLNIIQGNYTSFDGRNFNVFIIESEYCVLNIDTSLITPEQLSDTSTLQKVVQRVDALYAFYKDNLGFEPHGALPYKNEFEYLIITCH